MITSIINYFDNRELAIISWIIIGLIGLMFWKHFRIFLKETIDIILTSTFLIIYSLLIIYISTLIFLLVKIGFWDWTLLKVTIFWFIGVGIVLAVNGIGKDPKHFKKLAISCIKITILLEFITNLYVFSFFTEFLVLPVLLIIGVIQGHLEANENNKNILENFNGIVGIGFLIVFIIALYKTIINIKGLYDFSTLQNLLLPSILTIFMIPFSYLIALFSAYEIFFNKFKIYKIENYTKDFKRRIKKIVVLQSRFNLDKVYRMNINFNIHDAYASDNLKDYIKTILYK